MRFRRNATRVVLWGGRPTLDRQFGSPLDLRLSRIDAAFDRASLTPRASDSRRPAWVNETSAARGGCGEVLVHLKRAKDMTR